MFLKTVLTFFVVGAISVNALTIPVARSPAPEPESQELDAWMLKRGLSYDLFSRELQALDELFLREPEDWVEWAGFARDDSHIERPPKPIVRPYVPPATDTVPVRPPRSTTPLIIPPVRTGTPFR